MLISGLKVLTAAYIVVKIFEKNNRNLANPECKNFIFAIAKKHFSHFG
ncbi:Uncharacterized protein dnm_003230 [Desulfonema magnum]|uniref:Uncharacterized protein n=1 Tax=Desulfonema magnum TaxID=45655 RepID=A0A975GK34_9BACT|nr:Uncharacterized protein dnm_003230 [Desulfonema magnum]